jgi:polyisoprenyl-teichoic acid--peptidoglycan teichoic acid transferase
MASRFDPDAVTQSLYPSDPLAKFQPVKIQRGRRRKRAAGWVYGVVTLLVLLGVYFLLPQRTNILVLGIDRPPSGTAVSRSDTMILVTIIPLQPYVGMLSIPRDLWVPIADVGENRINTAHFFAEAARPGTGPAAAARVVRDNFGVTVYNTVRIRFDGVVGVIDAMGGVTIDLPEAASGLPAGKTHLDGKHALAFIRDRKGADDFFRMQHGQIFIRSVEKQLLSPLTWPRWPAVISAALRAIDTNIPVWLWPRLGLALVRAGSTGIDGRTITREMVTPFTTSGGAAVLQPEWDRINPVLKEMFGQ